VIAEAGWRHSHFIDGVEERGFMVFDGLLKPVIFRTNCSEAARTSSGVTGGSKL